jgi:hypothetical protein
MAADYDQAQVTAPRGVSPTAARQQSQTPGEGGLSPDPQRAAEPLTPVQLYALPVDPLHSGPPR